MCGGSLAVTFLLVGLVFVYILLSIFCHGLRQRSPNYGVDPPGATEEGLGVHDGTQANPHRRWGTPPRPVMTPAAAPLHP